MKQTWEQATITSCAIWGCGKILNQEWCLDWHKIDTADGVGLFATCQGGHGDIDVKAELISQADIVEQSRQRIARRRAQKNPYKQSSNL